MKPAQFAALFFDFDGVLTDNCVYVATDGTEMVRCTRADGLAFDAFRALGYKVFIVSTEANAVVEARARKLKVDCVHGVRDKCDAVRELEDHHEFSLKDALFVGNDINDLGAMGLCGASACPADSHAAVLQVATYVLASRGGEGVAREVAEKILGIDISEVLGRFTN